MTTIKAVDVSRWQGRVTELQWVSVRHAEYELAIVGLFDGARHNPYARVVVEAAKRAGLRVAGYAAVASGWTGQAIVNQAVANVDIKDLEFLALDVELTLDSPKQLRNALIQIGHWNLRPVIYSSITKWRTVMADNTDFADVPLWDAHYVRSESLPPWAPYGGWTGRVGLQYAANETIEHITADLNVFSRDWLDGSRNAVLDFDNSQISPLDRRNPTMTAGVGSAQNILDGLKHELESIADSAKTSIQSATTDALNKLSGAEKKIQAELAAEEKTLETAAEKEIADIAESIKGDLKAMEQRIIAQLKSEADTLLKPLAEHAALAAQHGIVTAIRAQADPAGSLTTAQINHIADTLAAVDVASEVDDAVDKLLEGNNA